MNTDLATHTGATLPDDLAGAPASDGRGLSKEQLAAAQRVLEHVRTGVNGGEPPPGAGAPVAEAG